MTQRYTRRDETKPVRSVGLSAEFGSGLLSDGPDSLPARVGPAELTILGGMIAVRCPSDLDPLMRKAGGMWEPSGRRRIGPLIRNLRRETDPLFRRVGIDLDEP